MAIIEIGIGLLSFGISSGTITFIIKVILWLIHKKSGSTKEGRKVNRKQSQTIKKFISFLQAKGKEIISEAISLVEGKVKQIGKESDALDETNKIIAEANKHLKQFGLDIKSIGGTEDV